MNKPVKQRYLSKKTSAKLCAELWEWLAKNPESYKIEWPGWKVYPNVSSHCFACNWVQKLYSHVLVPCKTHCFLIKLWPHTCLHYNSTFTLYNNARDSISRSLHASTIARASRKVEASCK